MPWRTANLPRCRILWKEGDDETFLDCSNLNHIRDDVKAFFGIKCMFLERTTIPTRYEVQFIAIDLSVHLPEYRDPEMVVLNGAFLRVLITANVMNERDRLHTCLMSLSRLVTMTDEPVRNEDWKAGHVMVDLLRQAILLRLNEMEGRMNNQSPVWSEDLFQWLHLVDQITDSVTRRHAVRLIDTENLRSAHVMFLQGLRAKYGVQMDRTPDMHAIVTIAPTGVIEATCNYLGYTTSLRDLPRP